MRKSHVRRLGHLKQQAASSLTPGGSQPSLNQNQNECKDSRALASDSSLRFSTCAQSTPKRSKISIDVDDEDPFADDDMPDEPVPKNPPVSTSNFKQPTIPKVLEANSDTNNLFPNCTKRGQTKIFMEDILEKCKFYLEGSPSGEHLMKTDKTCFLREIEKQLKQDSNDSLFLNDFKKYHSDNKKLELSFAPTKSEMADELEGDGDQFNVEDCLIRLLLHVGVIQSRLIVYLIERVRSLSQSEQENDEGIAWVVYLLRSLSYLGVIHDSKSLCEQLLDLMDTVHKPVIKREIIASLPDIINFDVHSRVAIKLSNLLQDDESLMPVILETLSILSLSEDILSSVQSATILSIKRSSLDALPAMVKFLISTCEHSYDDVINGIRSELTFEVQPLTRTQVPLSVQKSMEKKLRIETQKKVFSCIKDEMLFNRKFFDAWIKTCKMIAKQNPTEASTKAKPIDLVILIVMYSSCQSDKTKEIVVKVFRCLVLAGHMDSCLLKESLALYVPVLKDEAYFMPLMKLVNDFMRSSERAVVSFTIELTSQLMQYLQGRWVCWLLRDLVSIIGCGDAASVHNALATLKVICLGFKDKIQPMSSIVMILLNKLEDFTVMDMRQVLNILSFLSHSEDDNVSGDIHILVQKKLASIEVQSLRIGVTGAALIIKQISLVSPGEQNSLSSEFSNDTHSTNSTIMVTERATKALDLMDSVTEKLRNRGSDVLGLFYDQLAFMLFRENNIDVTFKVKVAELVKTKLKESFFVNNFEPENLSDPDTLKCSAQFCLSGNLCVNITHLLMQAKTSRNDIVICLPVLMRLLRVSDYLPNIDSLIDGGLILPLRSSYDVNSFSNLPRNHQELVVTSLFLGVNWFIEILNCFSNTLKKSAGRVDPELSTQMSGRVSTQSIEENSQSTTAKKVVLRLQHLVFLHQQLSRILPLLPSSHSFSPPRCYFHVDVKNPIATDKGKAPKPKESKPKKSGGTKRKATTTDDTLRSTCPDSTVLTAGGGGGEEELSLEEDKPAVLQADMRLYQSFFREMETDVWLILKESLILVPTPEKDCVFSGQLGPVEYLFLMNDAVRKLERCLPPTIKKVSALKSVASSEKTLGFDHLDVLEEINIVQKYISILPSLCKHTTNISNYLHRTWVAFDKIDDVPALFEPEARIIKLCLAQLFKSMAIVFSWNGFQVNPTHNPNTKHHLLYGLCVFTKCGSPNMSMSSKKIEHLNELVTGSVEYLSTFHEYVSYLPAAVSYIKLLRALSNLTPSLDNTAIQNKIGQIAWHFLTTRWYSLTGSEEKGALYCADVEFLLMSHFEYARETSNLDKIFDNLLNDIDQLTEPESRLGTIATIGKSNLHILIRCLCKGILNEIKLKMSSSESKDILQTWLKAFEHMDVLVKVLKDKLMHKSKTNLVAFLKQSKEIFKLFLKEGFAHLTGDNFVSENDLVCKILKKLQSSTRYIQNICNHTKKTEDLQMTKDLPIMKQMMELIILRVSGVMKENKCGDAIQVACLRIRDVAGREIDMDEDSDASESDDEEEEEVTAASPEPSVHTENVPEPDDQTSDNSELSESEMGGDTSNSF
uniref:Fanconi anemia group D2 protein n=1 Tax=Cacopsylla melanoneura TaxID=428564 RepID=A0A8D8Z1B5_9HEMI